VRLPQQLTAPFQDGTLGIEFPVALIGRRQLGLLDTIETGQLLDVDQLLFALTIGI